MSEILFAVLTISDSCHEDATKDKSGPRLVELLKDAFDNARIITEILPDEQPLIEAKLRQLTTRCEKPHVSAIITTGGTGFAPRDVTPEATKPLIHKDCPQLTLAIALTSLQKTKFAALSRGICGISGQTLIMNFPGSEKAVVECFEVVRDILPHALQLINNELKLVRKVHADLANSPALSDSQVRGHVCPHKTGKNDGVDRNSPFPMLPVAEALKIILEKVHFPGDVLSYQNCTSSVNVPAFRASVKDGYAMKSSGFSGTKNVIGYIAAGDEPYEHDFAEDECFKINTGAPIPLHADCVVQIEDTKLLKTKKNGEEFLVEILVEPKRNLDIREIGCDLKIGQVLFPTRDLSSVVYKSILAAVGDTDFTPYQPKIGIVSTGSELLAAGAPYAAGKIYDSNTTMLEELLKYFDFECMEKTVISDSFEVVKENIKTLFEKVDFIICTGGVSMGDKDYIKPALTALGFELHFGRVNMKPGKPMTFASKHNKCFFGLPGNPVSAFVTFHLFALPALRYAKRVPREKLELAQIQVKLDNQKIELDARPEYMRASIICRKGVLYAKITGNQMSSRLQSIVGADVLVQMPPRTEFKQFAVCGDLLPAYVLRYDFISQYE